MFRRVLVLVWSLCFWGALAVSENSTEPYSLRLVGGSRCQGQLQIQRPGEEWTGVHRWFFTREIGNRVCGELDCGSLLSVDGEETRVKSFAVRVKSGYCNDTSLVNCFRPGIYRSEHTLVELNCSDSVRLVGNQSLCSGSLMVRDQSLNQSWTGACEGALDPPAEEVLCRDLGCGAPAVADCEWTLPRTRPENCTTLQLTCREPVRLVGGSNRCEGTLELKHRGVWRRVMGFTGDLDMQAASNVCWSVGCGPALSTKQSQEFELSDVWAGPPDCMRVRAVRDCIFSLFEGSRFGQRVVCAGR